MPLTTMAATAPSSPTIYRHIGADKRAGGTLHLHPRGAQKRFRKRYGYYDRHSRLRGKRSISERPAIVEARGRIGDWEADTILGATGDPHCLLSLVERTAGYLVLGKLRARSAAEVNRRAAPLLQQQPHPVHTMTTRPSRPRFRPASTSRPRTPPGNGAPGKPRWSRGWPPAR